jgi:two-component system sensor histidine kinase MprB
VAVAVAAAALVCYMVVRSELLGQIDSALQAQAAQIQSGDYHDVNQQPPRPGPNAGGPAPYVQVVFQDGTVAPQSGDVTLPVTQSVMAMANGHGGPTLTTVTVGGSDLRQITVASPQPYFIHGQFEGFAVMFARPLGPTESTLSHIRLILLLVLVAGIALAAALGRVAAKRVLVPLAEVARTAQHVSETEDLGARIHVTHPDDEVGQLARRFNAMIERLQHSRTELDDSVRAQRQLVADASHELRTPVTSLRTNIEVLLAGGELDEREREQLLSDVVEQTEELSALVNDLIELARGDLPASATDDVRLDVVVEETLARARRNAPGVRFEASLAPVLLTGVAERLDRAIGNLLDNAARHSPVDGTVEVVVDPDGVRVRDHGGGIDEADLPYVFDRFYRGANSRGRQGSGLGLAIVRQVAEQHGGSVTAENAVGGGALFKLRLPGAPAPAEDLEISPGEWPAPVPGGRR